jgi:2-methylisocitrate lyase-like PEP mutase family enzyme
MLNESQIESARAFTAMHVPGDPLILYNAWDPGSAKAVRAAGARAIATGSWSVAAAAGFEDREQIPLELLASIVERMAAAVDVPLTVDFESGYARGGEELANNVRRIIEAGAVGINFEDQWIAEDVMYCVEEQEARIATVRRAADASGVPLFINARTDVFLRSEPAQHADHVDEAVARGNAYATAGASGLFVPGIRDGSLIERICRSSSLPVNVLWYPEVPPRERLAAAGVARISYGPRPYRDMMARLTEVAKPVLSR